MRIVLLLSALWLTTSLQAQSANDIVGTWLIQDQTAKVKITKSADNTYSGKVIWVKAPLDPITKKPITDNKNPNKAYQNRPIMGLKTIQNLAYKSGKWQGGTIYQPQSGRTYKCKTWIEKDGLHVRGYWGMLYGTSVWTKVE